jgi:hypothetical protein
MQHCVRTHAFIASLTWGSLAIACVCTVRGCRTTQGSQCLWDDIHAEQHMWQTCPAAAVTWALSTSCKDTRCYFLR